MESTCPWSELLRDEQDRWKEIWMVCALAAIPNCQYFHIRRSMCGPRAIIWKIQAF